MKKFSFTFQYLLDAHRAKEQAAEHALRMAGSALAEAEQALAAMSETGARQTRALEQMTGVVRPLDYSIYRESVDFIHQQIAALKQVCSSKAEAVEECRAALRKEVTSRRILENLCDRERVEWAEALRAEEQKQMDELAVVRWSRQEVGV
ncbi:flagellar export protein FliJ [Pontiella agarivorans]|uniref:Flagellar FliJ protein n=1 Tax=Pontiella agarivorans TaxID=3038953 RepID=A0ABU5MSV6_9BACT|nr:flagellar export protein FliJ [Pontiella agarivorans]MDZ8117284.1 flagellar export protein FliJ [Pontiella agarivorans]